MSKGIDFSKFLSGSVESDHDSLITPPVSGRGLCITAPEEPVNVLQAPTNILATPSYRQSYQQRWYRENAEEHKINVRANQQKVITENHRQIFEYLLLHPCVKCGENNVVMLEFHHRDPKTKRESISTLVCEGFSWKTIEIEIAKCDVLCSNCHQFKTAQDKKSPRYLLWMNYNSTH